MKKISVLMLILAIALSCGRCKSNCDEPEWSDDLGDLAKFIKIPDGAVEARWIVVPMAKMIYDQEPGRLSLGPDDYCLVAVITFDPGISLKILAGASTDRSEMSFMLNEIFVDDTLRKMLGANLAYQADRKCYEFSSDDGYDDNFFAKSPYLHGAYAPAGDGKSIVVYMFTT